MTIYEEIKKERDEQDVKWGREFDDSHSANDWVAFIAKYNGRATDSMKYGFTPEHREIFRKAMIKVAALAVAAVETMERNYQNES